MKVFRIIALILILTTSASYGVAQRLALKAADQAFEKNQYHRAIEKYKKAYKKIKDKECLGSLYG